VKRKSNKTGPEPDPSRAGLLSLIKKNTVMKKGTINRKVNFIIGLRPGVVVAERVIELPGAGPIVEAEIAELEITSDDLILGNCTFKNEPDAFELLEIAEFKKMINKTVNRG